MSILHNDEGMWLPYKLPKARLRELYGFEPSDGWTEHMQKASARMMSGGSASFISPSGLLVTNHHVAESILQDMSSEKKDYVKSGFYAEQLEDEVKVPHEEVNVLWEVEDVTDRMNTAVKPEMSAAQANEARKVEMVRIQRESFKRTGMRSDVVTLYRGGLYHLYRYKKYTDIRLVFAPEYAIAGFGSDIDNYEFPRYNLDVAFFRIYKNDKPESTPYYFKWATENPKEGQLLFITGHPGHTDRLSTLARILHLRDSGLPYELGILRREEIMLQQFAGRNEENKRIAHRALHGTQNIRKGFVGQLDALQKPDFIQKKREKEKELRQKVNADSAMRKKYSDAWDLIEKAEAHLRTIRNEYNLLEGELAFGTKLFGVARTLLRMETEDKKPDHKRLPEYTETEHESLLQELLSPAPIYRHFEEWKLADSLGYLTVTLGFDNKIVQKILQGKSPIERARELIAGTKLDNLESRKEFVPDGSKKPSESNDTMIQLARLIDRESRRIRKDMEENVEELRRQAYEKIARATFEIYGDDVYPDATFTLRITFGRVLSYKEGDEKIPIFTTIGETFAHADKHANKDPWELPERWRKNRATLENNGKALNFISVHDTHGGNSGSPVVDKDLRIHGLLFDGNIHANATTFLYVDEVERSISVSTAGILEVLQKLYKTDRLVDELLTKK